MRIDSFEIGTSAAAETVASTDSSSTRSGAVSSEASSLPEDTTTLSSGGESTVSGLTSQIMATASTRADKVDALREQVSSGQYQWDADAVAQSMIDASA